MRLAGPLPEFVLRCVKRFREERCAQVAASLAFTTLLGLVPLLTVALLLISNIDFFSGLGVALRKFLLVYLLPEKAGKVITAYALQFTQKTGRLTLLGTGMLFLTALLLMLSIDRVFGQIWRVKVPRPLYKRIALYLASLVFGPIVLGACVAMVTYIVTLSLGFVTETRWLTDVLLKILAVLLIATLASLVYYVVPNRAIVPLHAALGGSVTALGFALVQRGLSSYLAAFPTYRLIYGAFSSVPIFLLWLYLSWLAVLIGALVTAIIGEMYPLRK